MPAFNKLWKLHVKLQMNTNALNMMS